MTRRERKGKKYREREESKKERKMKIEGNV